MAQNVLVRKIGIDLGVIVCIGLLLLSLNWWSPYNRGFFVDDGSLRLPFKNQQISDVLLAIVGFAVIIVTIIPTEFIRDKQGTGVGEKFLASILLPGWVWESYTGLGVFIFGAACQQLTCGMAKRTLGRLRPYFFDVCQPSYNTTDPLNALGYIQNYECTGTTVTTDMRLSFPSGHSCFAMYTAVFFILYVNEKINWRGSKLLRHFAQYIVFMCGVYVGLSRVVDHMHHWSDVLAGFAIGALYAVLAFYCVLKPKKYGLPESWRNNNEELNDRLPRPAYAR